MCHIPDCPALLDWIVQCNVDNISAKEAEVSMSNSYWYDSIKIGGFRDPQSLTPKQATGRENSLSTGRNPEQWQTLLLMG